MGGRKTYELVGLASGQNSCVRVEEVAKIKALSQRERVSPDIQRERRGRGREGILQ